MARKILILGSLMALILGMTSVPSFAVIRVIRSTVGNVSNTNGDNTAIGSQAFNRIYATCDTAINKNNTVDTNCNNNACRFAYITNTNLAPGGFDSSTRENMNPYCGSADNLNFYSIWDTELQTGTPAHQGYYGASSVFATSAGIGDPTQSGCPGSTALNCFGRIDTSNAISAPLNFVSHGYGDADPHNLRAIGGLSPVPVPRISRLSATQVKVTWNDPDLYTAAMRGPASNVLGVNLYRFDDTNANGVCDEPSGSTVGWALVAPFPNGSGAAGTTQNITAGPAGSHNCTFFATTVRFSGPGGVGELESGGNPYPGSGGIPKYVGGNSQAINLDPTSTKIIRANAKYEGKGSVTVTWQSGLEGGLSGYYVQRGSTADGPYTRVSSMIAPRGDNTDYTFNDRLASPGTFYYRVEIVGTSGTSTFTSPTAVMTPVRQKSSSPKGISR